MPSKLKKCPICKNYNLTEKCRLCNSKTEDAHYKFIKIRDAPKTERFKENYISN